MRIPDVPFHAKRVISQHLRWNSMAIAGSFVLVGIAFVILCMTLRDVGLATVIAAIRSTPPQRLFAASVFVFCSYVTLTFYDYFALHAVGRREIPYPTAAFAGFASYAIGHCIGVTFLAGGAVRLRIYSAWGLGIIEVAKIAFMTGLTFWLGNVCALGLALTVAADAAIAVTKLPAWSNQALGIVGLAAVAGYIAWLMPKSRIVGFANWQVTLPNAQMTFVQIGIGVLDLAAGSLATYVLLPAQPSIDYVVVAVAYVFAALLGFLSHAPGSLGVFEVAMLVMLPQYHKDALLASLLILHCLYFVLPVTVALFMLGVRETRLAR